MFLKLGLGYFHAQDRGVQMVFTSVISQGRLSELIMDDDHTRLLDIWIKSLQMVDIVDVIDSILLFLNA